MKIVPRDGVLLVSKNDKSSLSVDLVISQLEEDKNLITCTVESSGGKYPGGTEVVVGKYSLYKLVYQGIDNYFIEEDDVVGIIK